MTPALRQAVARWAVLLGVPLIVRSVVHLQLRDDPFYERLFVDARLYHEVARVLADGSVQMTSPHWQPPFYPTFLSWIYRLTGPDPHAARWVQILLGAFTCGLTYSIALRLADRRAGWIAWSCVTFAAPLIFFDLQILPAALAGFLLLLVVRILQPSGDPAGLGIGRKNRGGDTGRGRRLIRAGVAGLSAGLASITVGNMVLLLPLSVLFVVWDRWRGRERIWLSPGGLLVFLLLASAPILWTLTENYKVSGELIPISYNAGINLWIGNNPEYDEMVAIRPGRAWSDLTSEPLRAGATGFRDQSDYFVAKTFDWIRTEPGAALGLFARKARLLLRGDEIPRNTELYPFRSSSGLFAALLWDRGLAFPSGLLVPLGLAGVVLVAVGRRPGPGSSGDGDDPWPLRSGRQRRFLMRILCLLLVYAASIVAFFVTSRYRVPVVPLLAIVIGVGGSALLALAPRSRGGRHADVSGPPGPSGTRTATVTATIALVLALALANVGAPAPPRVHGSDTQYDLGVALQEEGDLPGAVAQYEAALALNPGNPEAHNNLAGVALRSGDLERARSHLEAALSSYPGDRALRFNLARVHLARQDPYAAGSLLAPLRRDFPEDERIRAALAEAERGADLLDAEVGMTDPDRWSADLRARLEESPNDEFLKQRLEHWGRISRSGSR